MSDDTQQEKTLRTGEPDPKAPAALPKLPDLTFEAELGRGGMGVVWRAHQPFLDRRVAVKILSNEDGKWNQTTVDRFRREAKILGSLNHPHIVGCHNAGATDDNQLYIVMELVPGPNLGQYLRDNPPLTSLQTARLARDIASALQYAAERDLIHRDVKAENILLKPEERTPRDPAFPYVPKLVDLGLAKYQRHGTLDGNTITQSGVISGTPSVMAPEQFDDPDHVDHRADIYALGCVMFRALTGKNPFEGLTFTQLMHAKLAVGPPRARDAAQQVDTALDVLVAQMMDRDRDKRPQTYAEVIARLGALCPPDGSGSGTGTGRTANTQNPLPEFQAAAEWVSRGGQGKMPSLVSALLIGLGISVLIILGLNVVPFFIPPLGSSRGQLGTSNIRPKRANDQAPAASPTPAAPELLWDQDGQPVWDTEAVTRLAGWSFEGDARWKGDDTQGEAVVGDGTGSAEKPLGPAPWRVLGSLAMAGAPEAGVHVRLADGTRVAVRLQDFGGSALGTVGIEGSTTGGATRPWTAVKSFEPAAQPTHTFGLTVLVDRVVVSIDEAEVAEVPIQSPASALGLSVKGGRATFGDTSLHHPLAPP